MHLRLTVAALSLATALASSGAENLIYNGDFELAAPASPPPGWTMWGAEAYKVPANYSRDTVNPHSGQACFRLQHPANTAGYIVSAPDQAIRPEPGQRYAVSFWARTDTPGPSQFLWTAYRSIAPFADAPSPGSRAIEVGSDWREFRFSIDEGWDFFADRCQYLLLTFVPTQDKALEKTLWIDDVAVTATPSPRRGRLVDESRLEYEPLNHRLTPGDRLEVTIDAGKILRPASREVGGISFHRVCGWTGQPYDRQGAYTLAPELEQAIRDLRLPMTRFYAVGDEPFGVEGALDRAFEMVGKVGVPAARTVLELETQGATSKLPPEVWAKAAAYVRQKGYGFTCWEVANEPYITRGDAAFKTPDEYLAHVRAVSAALRQAQPGCQVGLAISDSQNWGNSLLKEAAGSYDFVVGHYYAFAREIHRRKFEVAVLTENYATLDRILRANALIQAYNPGREVYQLDTEWGVHSGGPNGEVADSVNRNANIFGTLHRAVRLIYYAREGMLRGASSWQMLSQINNQGFGVLAQETPTQRFMIYWLYYYFNRHVGAQVLASAGTAPYYTPAAGDDPLSQAGAFPGPLTPLLATLSQDGNELYLILANGSWDKAAPLSVALRNFPARKANAVCLSSADPDATPLLERKEDFVSELPLQLVGDALTGTLPPHSAVFVTLQRR
jgi:alpha-L-arabinofuranosidase